MVPLAMGMKVQCWSSPVMRCRCKDGDVVIVKLKRFDDEWWCSMSNDEAEVMAMVQ